jgi:hypothetical protein
MLCLAAAARDVLRFSIEVRLARLARQQQICIPRSLV